WWLLGSVTLRDSQYFPTRRSSDLGAERVLLFVMAVLTLGLLLRGLENVAWLFIGAGLAGAAIAMGNVLLPGVVKREFAKHAAIIDRKSTRLNSSHVKTSYAVVCLK